MKTKNEQLRPADRPRAVFGHKTSADVDPEWAWSEYEPTADRPWTRQWAGHLYRRAAYGASLDQLDDAVTAGAKRTIELVMRPDADINQFDRQYDGDVDAISRSGGMEGPRAWWLRRMVETPHPLQERMTLFWHSHFGVANHRVKSPLLMIRHIRMLRKNALGGYAPMLAAATRDPAVLLGLDAAVSRRSMPNESVPRQLMERLSLGPGHFGEEDVREAARAFTGWFVLRGKLRFFSHEHDTGTKTVLGKEGKWDADDIVRMVLDSTATAQLLTRKLYRWFISEVDDPSGELLGPLVTMMAADYDIGAVVERMLRSNLFFSEFAYRQRVKSPVDFALGLVRAVGGMIPTQRLGVDLASLGQDLYNPPTVRGWLGGSHWINASTIIGRANLANELLAAKGVYGGRLDLSRVVPSGEELTIREAGEMLLDLLLQGDVESGTLDRVLKKVPSPGQELNADSVREIAYQVLALPEFQLG